MKKTILWMAHSEAAPCAFAVQLTIAHRHHLTRKYSAVIDSRT
jgi:hypothetical protein